MLKGKINLTLMMGPVEAVPVSQPIVDALNSIQVTTASGQASGFQMDFTFSSKSILSTLLLLLAEAGPFIRTIVVVTINGSSVVLVDGMITNHQLSPNVQTGQSTLTVTGSDLTCVMDLIEFTGIPYPAMPAEARIALCIAKYALFGMIPLVIPSLFINVPIPTERIPVHQGTDLAYIRRLADDAGYVFYIEPGPVAGTNIAYWGPEIKIGIPQPALNINMDAHTNVESLNFSINGDAKSMPIVFIQNEMSGIPIPIPVPDISILNPPLGLLTPISIKFPMMQDTANLDPVDAINMGLGEASRTSDVVSATGSLDVIRYGHILKARGLVGIRGSGLAFDGLYYVKSVTHKIQRGQYKQDFSLSRNGLISIVPNVPV